MRRPDPNVYPLVLEPVSEGDEDFGVLYAKSIAHAMAFALDCEIAFIIRLNV